MLKDNGEILSKAHEYIENLMTLSWNRANDEGWGVGWYDPKTKEFDRYTQEGPLKWAAKDGGFHKNYPIMIAHGIYSNSGKKETVKEKLHPIFSENRKLLFAFNGNVPNHEKIREKLLKEYGFGTDGDTETLANLLEKKYIETQDIFNSVKFLYSVIDGPCNFEAIFDDGSLAIGRSPDGNRPLYIANNNKVFSFASESSPLHQFFKLKNIRAVSPGEVIVIKDKTIDSKTYRIKPVKRCIFEYAYFSNPDSEFDGVNIGLYRRRIGKMRALKIDTDPMAIVSPVPDTGIEYALGFAEGLLEKRLQNCKTVEEAQEIIKEGIPYYNSLIKNRFGGIKRTFLQNSERLRDHAISIKFKEYPEYITDKVLHLLDDSLVRGRTIKKIVKELMRFNPKALFLDLGFPPIEHPCYSGIDMQTRAELMSANMTKEEIKKTIKVDGISFTSVEEIAEALGFPQEELCTACVTGIYPIKSLVDLDKI